MATKTYKKFLTGAATAAMVASAVAPVAAQGQDVADTANKSFNDIGPDSSHYVNVIEARELGFLSGYGDGSFKPNKTLNRGDVTKMLGKYVVATSGKTLNEYVEDNNIADVPNFADVPNSISDKELVTYSKIVKHAEIFQGANNNLMPTKEMNRDQIALVLVRAFDLEDKAGDTKVVDGANSAYEKEIEILLENGVSNANPYKPFNKTSRAQFASFLVRAYKVSMGWDPTKPLPEPGNPDPGTDPDPEPGLEWEGDIGIDASKDSLLADGKDTSVITFSILDEKGNVDTDADNIVLALDATHGTFSSERVTVQDGVATATLTSEQSNKDLEVLITATVAEASEGYKDLIGEKQTYGHITFVAYSQNVETLNLTGAESNQTDRVTLHFDREVSLEDFVVTSPTGELNYQYRQADGSWGAPTTVVNPLVDPADVRHALKPEAINVLNAPERINGGLIGGGSIDGASNYLVDGILGLKPVEGDSKSVEVILEKDSHLLDNSHVVVVTNFVSESGKISNSATEFILTDARTPEVTGVSNSGLNEVNVKFSEAIEDGTADFLIDGTYNANDDAAIEYGEFDARTLEDNRDTVSITLGGEYSTPPTPAGYFTAGNHSIQVANATDFAGNKATTQNLNFTVEANTTQPSAEVTVESPEQFIVEFNTDVRTAEVENFAFQVYNEDTEAWESITSEATDEEVGLEVSNLGGNTYAFELTEDWTQIYDTEGTNDNYYNYEYRIVYAKDDLQNLANGVTNAEQVVLDLSYDGSPLNSADTTSPEITEVVQDGTSSTFTVTTNEPVKIAGEDNAGDTLSQKQESVNNGTLPEVKGTILAKVAGGKTVEVDATVNGYVDGYDNKFTVTAGEVTLAEDVTENRVVLIPAGTYSLQELVDFGYLETDFELVLSQLTDDVGNTANTATYDFEMEKTVVNPDLTPFYLVKAEYENYNVEGNNTQVDIAVTFSEGVAAANSAADITKWSINGHDLPVGTSIKAENRDGVAGNETVIITVTDPSLFMYEDNVPVGEGGEIQLPVPEVSNVITVDREIASFDGSKLTGRNQLVVGIPAFLQNVNYAIELLSRVAALDEVEEADRELIEAARANYNSLNALERNYVSPQLVAQLEAAEEALGEAGEPTPEPTTEEAIEEVAQTITELFGLEEDVTLPQLAAANPTVEELQELATQLANVAPGDVAALQDRLGDGNITEQTIINGFNQIRSTSAASLYPELVEAFEAAYNL
ncbi:Parasporal protein [Bhargavaea cecembensis DSE10]|uniref:Parasporal protein n=1 Tax=Bhargavaea cecembensis DSE10 TaxID=1235279 RepID=M7NLC3_9BACL|nr:S-layer homology domain-containing protein [Bhargavaea cecembensis]EMR07931.1 Parasporal protein [Bhargavaea cecembensis DSE10]